MQTHLYRERVREGHRPARREGGRDDRRDDRRRGDVTKITRTVDDPEALKAAKEVMGY
jgi:hypothetical protein